LGDPSYAKALLGDGRHWVRSLPGKLIQNIISHGICKIAEFLKDDDPKVIAEGYASSMLLSIGAADILDELRVIIRDHTFFSAYFTFSSQLRPIAHYMKVFGTKNSLSSMTTTRS